ncbi:MAG TPA: AraC family transcriptional regulator [Fimbriimonadaceae bacterium]|nr:AraC family transcriptional regulator [Fimbriimonadaceae bacterium]
MRRHHMYLDIPPTTGTLTAFTLQERMEWVQAPDWHLFVICRHEGILQTSGVTHPFANASALVIAPGSRCRIDRTNDKDPGTHWWWNFRPPSTGQNKVALRSTTLLEGIDFWDPMLRRGFDLIPYSQAHLTATMWNLLLSISETAAEVRGNPALMAVERHIAANLASDLSIGELAQAANLSHNHLIRLFRMEHGMTPTEYIRAERMNRACHLILSTEMPFKEIGVAVGYPNQQHFHNIIKMTFGCAPQDIRLNRDIPKLF